MSQNRPTPALPPLARPPDADRSAALAESDRASRAGVSIVVPAYNEEHGLPPVLEQLRDIMAAAPGGHEIIVVDDGSQDGTAAVCARFPNVTLLRHAHNRGYGAALKTGIRQARFDLVCITDADGTYPNDRIPDLVQRMELGYHMVVGARRGEHVAIPVIRRPAKWMIGRLANWVAGEVIDDVNSGLRVFRRSTALRFFRVLPDTFSFTTTITLAMLTNDYRVDYVPVNYYARTGRSKIHPIRDTLRFIQLILRIGLYFAPLKIFLSMSAILLVIGIVWGAFSEIVLGRLADVSTLVIIMTAFQIAGVGLLAELINRRLPFFWNDER